MRYGLLDMLDMLGSRDARLTEQDVLASSR